MLRRMCCWPTRYTRSKRVAFILFQMLTACKRTFRCFVRAVAWIPVIFVSAVIIWGYYVYVYVMNICCASTHCFKVVNYTNCMFPIFLPGAFPKGSPTVSALVSGWQVYANQYNILIVTAVGPHYFTDRTGMPHYSRNGTDRQCTAELYSAMRSQNTKLVMRFDDLRDHQTILLKKKLASSLPPVKPKVGEM